MTLFIDFSSLEKQDKKTRNKSRPSQSGLRHSKARPRNCFGLKKELTNTLLLKL
jgi:hypothetical protein